MTKTGKHCEKKRNCSCWAISSFVTLFSKKSFSAEASESVHMKGKYHIWCQSVLITGNNIKHLQKALIEVCLYCFSVSTQQAKRTFTSQNKLVFTVNTKTSVVTLCTKKGSDVYNFNIFPNTVNVRPDQGLNSGHLVEHYATSLQKLDL